MSKNPFDHPEIRPSLPLSGRGIDTKTDTPRPSIIGEGLLVESPTDKGDGKGLSPEFHVRRSSLTPIVRFYADRLYASIKKIYAKYGVSSADELHAKIASGNKPKNIKPGELTSDSQELFKLLSNLKFALEKNAIPEGEQEREGFVVLHNVPTFEDILPSVDILMNKKNGYKFDYIWRDEYREGRPASDFALTEQDLSAMGYGNPKKRQELLREIAEAKKSGGQERLAKVFDISEIIAKKKAEHPNNPNWLTTKEVLEVMDQAGFRPATLEELLAFCKEYWQPEIDPKTLTDEEMKLQRVNACLVYALGSLFSDSYGDRWVPCIIYRNDVANRILGGYVLVDSLKEDGRFLALRKLSA